MSTSIYELGLTPLVGENPTCSVSRHCGVGRVYSLLSYGFGLYDIVYTPPPPAPALRLERDAWSMVE